MKIRFGYLRRILKESQAVFLERNNFLFEDDTISHRTGESGDSLDSQVDRYLAQYEDDAKKGDQPSVDQMESLEWRSLVRGQLITEEGQDDDQTSGEDDDLATPDDEDAGAEAGIEGGDEPKKLSIDKIDVESFANSVVRLIENYESLLEVRSTLQRRAIAFLEKVYDEEVVDAFKNTLRDDHGLVAGEDQGSIESDKFPAPAVDRANGSAAPGGGGGTV